MAANGSEDRLQAGGPLAGLRVIDWTHVLAGPFAGYQLGLLGAEVIRIERADADDLIRSKSADPALGALGLGEAFIAQGAGKRSMAVDARDPRARQALTALIATADVLVENFRPGKLAALGFDPRVLIERHPRLVVCSITGFGQQSHRRAYDHVVQAASGMMMSNADSSGRPQRIGFPVIDYAAGQQAAMAITAALYRRDRQPRAGIRARGEWLHLSMSGAALSLLAPAYAPELISGITPPRSASTAFSGSPLSGTFEAQDGFLAVVCNALDQAQGLMRALHLANAPADALDALQLAARQGNVATAQQVLAELFRSRTVADWDARLTDHGVPVTAVATAAEAARAASGQWPRVALPAVAGSATVCVPGIGFESTEPLTVNLSAPPLRGADTRALLAECGLDAGTIEAMLSEGAAWAPAP